MFVLRISAVSGQAQDVPCEGKVIAAGPGRTHPLTGTLIPMCVSEGDTVLFSKYSGRKVRVCRSCRGYLRAFYGTSVITPCIPKRTIQW